jgi:hypothetical protein
LLENNDDLMMPTNRTVAETIDEVEAVRYRPIDPGGLHDHGG